MIVVKQNVNLPAHAGGAAALIIWYTVICLSAMLQYAGLINWLILIFYVLIIRNLFKLSKELDEAGYAVKPVAVRVPDWAIVTAILTFLAVGITCGYLFFNSYPMDWQLVEVSTDTEVEEIKSELIELGFPETILEDFTDEDIKACEGALRVVVEVDNYPMNDIEGLQVIGVGVALPGEDEQWKIFHHFLWKVDPEFYGTEAIQLWTAYNQWDGWESVSDFSGHVLYDRDGQSYVAPYYSLSSEIYTSDNIFWGEQTSTDVFATFSMPNKGENYRGYLSYTVEEVWDGPNINSWFNYIHQKSWMQYPVMSAMERRMNDGWNNAGAFRIVQYDFAFNPNYDPSNEKSNKSN